MKKFKKIVEIIDEIKIKIKYGSYLFYYKSHHIFRLKCFFVLQIYQMFIVKQNLQFKKIIEAEILNLHKINKNNVDKLIFPSFIKKSTLQLNKSR